MNQESLFASKMEDVLLNTNPNIESREDSNAMRGTSEYLLDLIIIELERNGYSHNIQIIIDRDEVMAEEVVLQGLSSHSSSSSSLSSLQDTKVVAPPRQSGIFILPFPLR